MKRQLFSLSILLCSAALIVAKEKRPDPTLELKAERKVLQSLKKDKLEILERAEASRWEARYKHNNSLKEQEQKAKSLESLYARLASDLSRAQDDWLRAKNDANDAKTVLEETKSDYEAMRTQFGLAIDREAEKISTDFPINIAERTASLTQLSGFMDSKERNDGEIISDFFDYRTQRLNWTLQQRLQRQSSFYNDEERLVWRLMLGTVLIGEKTADEEGKPQLLLRTGKLQGKVFVWRYSLAGDFDKVLAALISKAISGDTNAYMPIDVLQNRSYGSGFVQAEKQTARSILMGWFNKGGIIMYPLLIAAFLGLLLSLERMFVLFRKSTASKRFMARLMPYIEKEAWEQAVVLCDKSSNSLSRVMSSILAQAGKSRRVAERALKESVLREIPFLEKRMTLIAAIGGSAPLMGLLGTVSGMISLFKTITEVGTNDPKILAGGISEALVTTQTGLIIAIPILLIHGYLSDRLEKVENDITSTSTEVLNKIWPEE